MAIDRTIWTGVFDREQFPTLPCPTCSRGRAAFDKATLRVEEPTYSAVGAQRDDWEPDWTIERFSAHMRCAEPKCGEVVVLSGETVFTETDNAEYGPAYISALRPRMMFPAPRIIEIPKDTPPSVSDRVKAAFGLFWFDLGACANSLRMSVEFLLDHLKVPRSSISAKTGKSIGLDLNGRIQSFEKTSSPHASTFHALRVVGNLGSHGALLQDDTVLDAFEIYEDALSDIIGGRPAYLEALKKKLLTQK